MTEVYKGSSSHSIFIELVDSTTGLPKTGIAHTAATAYYARTRSAAVAMSLSALASAAATFTAGGWYELDATNMPGIYRLDVTNAAFSSSASVDEVVVTVKATGCRTVSRGFTLIAFNKQASTLPASVEAVQGDVTAAVKLALLLYGWSDSTTPGTQASTGLYNLATAYFNTSRLAADLTHIGGTAISFAAGDVTTARMAKIDNLDAAVTTRLATAGYTAPPTAAANASAVRTELATELARVDVATSTRMATFSYTAPDNTGIAAIKAKTDNLPIDPADASDVTSAFGAVNSTLATIAGYVDTEVAAIKAKTDNLPSDPADASVIAAAFTSLANDVDIVRSNLANTSANVEQVVGDTAQLLAMTEGVDADRAFTVTALANAPAGGGGGGGSGDIVNISVEQSMISGGS